MRRLEVANAALAIFAGDTSIFLRGKRVCIRWKTYRGEILERQWVVRGGQSFYPTWSHTWGHGGTCCTALSQLVRWIQGRPVLPMSSWRYWCSPTVYLARQRGDELIATLADAGYPVEAHCVLCGNVIQGGLDWWNFKNVSGPCCGWTTGCRQQPLK